MTDAVCTFYKYLRLCTQKNILLLTFCSSAARTDISVCTELSMEEIPLVSGRLHPRDEKVLQKCFEWLSNEVEAEDIVPHLVTSRTLTSDDQAEIGHGKTPARRVRLLLEKLLTKGSHSYEDFLDALTKEGYHFVVDELAKQVRHLQKEDDGADHNEYPKRRSSNDVTHAKEEQRTNLLEGRLHDVEEELKRRSQEVEDASETIRKLKDTISFLKSEVARYQSKLVELKRHAGISTELEAKFQKLQKECVSYSRAQTGLKKQLELCQYKLHLQEEKNRTQSREIHALRTRLKEEHSRVSDVWSHRLSVQTQDEGRENAASTLSRYTPLIGRQLYERLVSQGVEAKDLVPHLISYTVLSDEDCPLIDHAGTRQERMRRLLNRVQTLGQGPLALLGLITVFESAGYRDAARELRISMWEAKVSS